MSFLTPVYLAGTLKGIVMVDVNQDNFKKYFLYPGPSAGLALS
ncbi:diguanylate cylase [Salmonella enterica subsp. enterica]|uniref:Diguanylate cylase n=1 Tax=Salmonella enterica I TaxID=59201 RepID=A0A379WVW3_SALET|nr:diguanylate cylase [Salmonella enterica subsp. enterica]